MSHMLGQLTCTSYTSIVVVVVVVVAVSDISKAAEKRESLSGSVSREQKRF